MGVACLIAAVVGAAAAYVASSEVGQLQRYYASMVGFELKQARQQDAAAAHSFRYAIESRESWVAQLRQYDPHGLNAAQIERTLGEIEALRAGRTEGLADAVDWLRASAARHRQAAARYETLAAESSVTVGRVTGIAGSVLTNVLLLLIGTALIRRRPGAARLARLAAFPVTLSAIVATAGFVVASNQLLMPAASGGPTAVVVSPWAVAAVWIASALALAILLGLRRDEPELVAE